MLVEVVFEESTFISVFQQLVYKTIVREAMYFSDTPWEKQIPHRTDFQAARTRIWCISQVEWKKFVRRTFFRRTKAIEEEMSRLVDRRALSELHCLPNFWCGPSNQLLPSLSFYLNLYCPIVCINFIGGDNLVPKVSRRSHEPYAWLLKLTFHVAQKTCLSLWPGHSNTKLCEGNKATVTGHR